MDKEALIKTISDNMNRVADDIETLNKLINETFVLKDSCEASLNALQAAKDAVSELV